MEVLALSNRVFEYQDTVLSSYTQDLQTLKEAMEHLSQLTHALAQSKQAKTACVMPQELALAVHQLDPHILGAWFREDTETFDTVPCDQIDPLLQRLTDAQQIKGTEVSQLVNEIQRIYGDQGQMVDIARDMNKQLETLLNLISQNSRV